MRNSLVLSALVACLVVPASTPAAAKKSTVAPAATAPATFESKVAGLERREGLITIHVDGKAGRILFELPAPAGPRGEVGRFLYIEGLLTGLGSNPVGLDRGQLGATRLVILRRVGGRLLIEQPNLFYRALTDNPIERLAVEQSFATSVLWAGAIEAEAGDGRLLIDMTSFIARDAHGVAATLKANEQGSFELDADRSVPLPDACLAFPDNVELEALLTFGGSEPGSNVRQVTPTPESITLVQHHSFLRLPDDGYRPREFDPRAGSFEVGFQDHAAALDAPMDRRLIVRHRLEKVNPGPAPSRVLEPIVYYVDSGAPEPVRGALLDGARWWAEAFERAGFIDAFRVEVLPEGVHPLDARYNVIQWIHRSTRGWSYGGGVTDPRTGEMIKGHVSLGSLRVRQDLLLFEGLLGTERTGRGGADDPLELALARIRQLSAHEVGHTLGLAHNFAASTYGRASVMDYPAPLVTLDDRGELDASAAYGVGVGEWDVHAIRYAYSDFGRPDEEAEGLKRVVEDGLRRGLLFLTDQDARHAAAAHPLANLWDNGADPVDELERVLSVRRVALDRFSAHNIAPGRPLALLEEVLAPLYLHHRYQLTAAAKVIGGLDYRYAVRGDGQAPARPLDGARQRRALEVLLQALTPEALDLPEATLALLSPRPFGHGDNRELFRGQTRPAFDALGAAATAAGLVVDELLQPERCARLIDFHRRDPGLPSLDAVLQALIRQTLDFESGSGSERTQALTDVVGRVVVDGLIRLSRNTAATAEVRAVIDRTLVELAARASARAASGGHDFTTAQAGFLGREIQRYLDRPYAAEVDFSAAEPPPGSPIGSVPPELASCSRVQPWR